MAAESTEPKTGVIIRVAIATIVILVVGRFALMSYFRDLVAEEVQSKAAASKPEQLVALRQQEQHDLYFGKLPVNKAMMLMASDLRTRHDPEIAPEQSTDLAALAGWTQKPVPPAKPPLVVIQDAGTSDTTNVMMDGSAPGMTPDASAPKTQL